MTEYLEDYKCLKCKESTRAEKKLEIVKLPEVLVIHIKPFGNWEEEEKLQTSVIFFVQKLELNHYVNSEDYHTGNCEDHTYRLISMINHYGDTMDQGHYKACYMIEKRFVILALFELYRKMSSLTQK